MLPGVGFPWFTGPAPGYAGPFRANVVDFLATYGKPVPLQLQNTKAWIVPLQLGKVTVRLHVYEEATDEDPGVIPICDSCRNIGAFTLLPR